MGRLRGVEARAGGGFRLDFGLRVRHHGMLDGRVSAIAAECARVSVEMGEPCVLRHGREERTVRPRFAAGRTVLVQGERETERRGEMRRQFWDDNFRAKCRASS